MRQLRQLREGNGRICKVRIPRNNPLDRIAFAKPGKRIQRTRSVQNLQSDSPPSNISRPIVAQLDISKIRSILLNPIGKPRRISFGRRKSMPSRVTFDLSNPDPPQCNEVDLTSQQDNSPLIDFSTDENVALNQNGMANSTSTTGELLQPSIAPSTIAPRTNKQTVPTKTNQNSILDEFDPLMASTDANESTTNCLLPTNSVPSPSNCDKITPSPRVYRPVPYLMPITPVLSPSNGNKVVPSPCVRRPVPYLMPINSARRIKITHEALSNALRSIPTTSSGRFHTVKNADINLPVFEKSSVNDTTFDETMNFDKSEEQFGRLHYVSDSDSD